MELDLSTAISYLDSKDMKMMLIKLAWLSLHDYYKGTTTFSKSSQERKSIVDCFGITKSKSINRLRFVFVIGFLGMKINGFLVFSETVTYIFIW